VHEVYPSKEALEANGGMENAMPETFSQLDELLVDLVTKYSDRLKSLPM